MKSKVFWQLFITGGAVALGVKMFLCKNNVKIQPVEITQPGISRAEVAEVQRQWGESLVKIGEIYSTGGDYDYMAFEHIERFYAYDSGAVLFKPTLASKQQFRTDREGALSYFVGGNDNYPEDHGFAIKPWLGVRWENIGTTIKDNIALAMGNYYFTPADGSPEVKVEYSFAYIKDKNGNLRIVLHDSHLPYQPNH